MLQNIAIASHAHIFHVTARLMLYLVAGYSECWKSVALQSTHPELEGLWMLAGPTK